MYLFKKSQYLTLFFITLCTLCLVISPPILANTAEQDFKAYQDTKFHNKKWDRYVKEGMSAFHNEEYDIAHKSLYKAFNLGCESPLVLFQLALINEYKESFYSALEYYQQAKKQFKHANRNHRYNKTFNENYGRALYYNGKIDQALPLLKKAAKRTKSFWLLKLIGMLAYEKGDTLSATSYFERAVRIKSNDVTPAELVYIYRLLGKLYLAKGQTDGALRYYNMVLKLNPNDKEASNIVNNVKRQYQKQKMINFYEKLKDS